MPDDEQRAFDKDDLRNFRALRWHPLDDLTTITDIARKYGVGPSAVSNWRKRYPDFPAPILTLADGGVCLFSAQKVDAWHKAMVGREVTYTVTRKSRMR